VTHQQVIGKNGEESGDVLANLPGVVAAQIASETRRPELARPLDESQKMNE